MRPPIPRQRSLFLIFVTIAMLVVPTATFATAESVDATPADPVLPPDGDTAASTAHLQWFIWQGVGAPERVEAVNANYWTSMPDVRGFYGYNSFTSSAHTGFEDAGVSNVFLYMDGGGVSLVFIHDAYGGTDGRATFQFQNLPSSGWWVVQDDPGDFTTATLDRVDWRWSDCCSDGGAFRSIADMYGEPCQSDGESPLPVNILPIIVQAGFNEKAQNTHQYSSNGITEWRFLADDVYTPRVERLNMDRPLYVWACPLLPEAVEDAHGGFGMEPAEEACNSVGDDAVANQTGTDTVQGDDCVEVLCRDVPALYRQVEVEIGPRLDTAQSFLGLTPVEPAVRPAFTVLRNVLVRAAFYCDPPPPGTGHPGRADNCERIVGTPHVSVGFELDVTSWDYDRVDAWECFWLRQTAVGNDYVYQDTTDWGRPSTWGCGVEVYLFARFGGTSYPPWTHTNGC